MENEGGQKSRTFKTAEAQELNEFLQSKLSEPVPEPESFKIQKLVRIVYPTLKELREKGYTNRMLVAMLAEKGIDVKPTHLSAYMTAARRAEKTSGPGTTTGTAPGTAVSQPPQRERSNQSGTGRRAAGAFEMKPDTRL